MGPHLTFETTADGPVRPPRVWTRSVPEVVNWRNHRAFDGGPYALVEQYAYAFRIVRIRPSRGRQRRRMNRFTPSHRTARRAAVLATIGFAVIVVFQAALAAGAPLGHAAWGGAEAELTTGERIGSGIAVVLWTIAALVVLGRAGVRGRAKPTRLFHWGTWFFAAVTAISAVAQFASESRWENFIWGPLALILAVLCTIVALSPPTTDS